MSKNDTIIRDVRHVKSARELLRWNQTKLAEEADLSLVSVKRYEAARDVIADEIEHDILAALERAGVVFVGEGEYEDTRVSGGVLLKATGDPVEPKTKQIYLFGKPTGRPAGRPEKSARRPRIDRRKKPEA